MKSLNSVHETLSHSLSSFIIFPVDFLDFLFELALLSPQTTSTSLAKTRYSSRKLPLTLSERFRTFVISINI